MPNMPCSSGPMRKEFGSAGLFIGRSPGLTVSRGESSAHHRDGLEEFRDQPDVLDPGRPLDTGRYIDGGRPRPPSTRQSKASPLPPGSSAPAGGLASNSSRSATPRYCSAAATSAAS